MEQMFFIRFLQSALLLSVLIVVLLMVKQVLQRHISSVWNYRIGLLLIVMLWIPFVPQEVFWGSPFEEGAFWNQEVVGEGQAMNTSLVDAEAEGIGSERVLKDFAVSVDYEVVVYLNKLGMGIWFLGGTIYLGLLLQGYSRLRRIRESIQKIEQPEIWRQFEDCKKTLGITKPIQLGTSTEVHSPMAFGIRKTYIVLPGHSLAHLSIEDIQYILLHELIHYKNRDLLISGMMSALQVIYWFHPLVHIAFRRIRNDREVACDYAVLSKIDKTQHIAYGKTLLRFAEIAAGREALSLATSMGGTKKQIKRRLLKIVAFKPETKLIRLRSLVVFGLMALMIVNQGAVLSVMAYDTNGYNFEERNVVYEDLSAYFGETEGGFVLYDVKAEQYRIHNKQKSLERVSPNSTYKIYSALIALETGVIQERDSTLVWNGKRHPYADWNQDQNIYSAMENSVSWYFQQLDSRVGRQVIQDYLEQIAYGNTNLTGGIEGYWMESSLMLSPVEQVQLLREFYTEQMVFEPRHIALVKETLKLGEKNGVTLSGKTG
ncbi:MAG: BlaR1 family beta-lactam sensor/signal transducer, partial [Cellulosilyticaceae bacterium]